MRHPAARYFVHDVLLFAHLDLSSIKARLRASTFNFIHHNYAGFLSGRPFACRVSARSTESAQRRNYCPPLETRKRNWESVEIHPTLLMHTAPNASYMTSSVSWIYLLPGIIKIISTSQAPLIRYINRGSAFSRGMPSGGSQTADARIGQVAPSIRINHPCPKSAREKVEESILKYSSLGRLCRTSESSFVLHVHFYSSVANCETRRCTQERNYEKEKTIRRQLVNEKETKRNGKRGYVQRKERGSGCHRSFFISFWSISRVTEASNEIYLTRLPRVCYKEHEDTI